MTSDKVEIATSFNELFVSVGKRHSPLNQQSFNSLNTLSRVGSTFKFQSKDSEFVKREVGKIDVNKAVGLDDLHPRLLKIAAPFIAEPLSIVFNKSLSSGCFPSDFQKSQDYSSTKK